MDNENKNKDVRELLSLLSIELLRAMDIELDSKLKSAGSIHEKVRINHFSVLVTLEMVDRPDY